jgi:hypothetical protein
MEFRELKVELRRAWSSGRTFFKKGVYGVKELRRFFI